MGLVPAWLRGGNDHELARTLADQAARKQRERGSMGRGHRNVAGAAAAGERWEESDRRRFGKNPFYRR